jgi:peptide/nickel transport system substrate-binding protein
MDANYWSRDLARRRVDRRRFLAGAVAAAGAGFLAACSRGNNQTSSSSGSATKGGSLTQAIVGTDAKSFQPYLTTDAPSASYQGYIYGVSMSKRDPKSLAQVPFGATWTVSDDKKTYTFTLKDIKWSDGQPLTTDDFVWTYQQAIKPENKYPYVDNLALISSYTAKDPKTLVVTLNDALTVGLEAADSITPLPRHIWEKYPWGDPSKNPEILNPSVVSGMWKLKEWKQQDHATFLANDSYFDGRPNIDQMTIRVFGTPEVAFQALKSGQIDYNTAIQPADYKSAKSISGATVYEWYPAAGQWLYTGFNLRRQALMDANVRHAMAYASDRKGLIDAAAFGLGKPIYAGFVQESPVFYPNVEHYDFDPKKAGDLLKQAGYTLDSNKHLVKDGKQLSFKLLYPTSSKPREAIATILKQQLGDLGIAVDVQGLEFQSYVSAIQSEPFDWDLQLGGWDTTIDPYWTSNIWSQKFIPDLNAGAYVNPQVESLFTQGSMEFDEAERKQIYAQIQTILANDSPYVFLYEPLTFAGMSKKVGGIQVSPLGIEYNMNQWFIKQ